ncbi:hypothetical protein PF001_g19627 [Phytophthora fragariae]|uniref:Uncharacterized protein n=1 Tax=Phytophthora fragariae TaxID=53985 RepID=A0A6A3EJ16_9STRA|nr:hypothetical protein PF009_g19767 [Phytophthora fragariae]KAE9290382.1 hypothetical protein PF001_g19627 [Phytophthora fragariae]
MAHDDQQQLPNSEVWIIAPFKMHSTRGAFDLRTTMCVDHIEKEPPYLMEASTTAAETVHTGKQQRLLEHREQASFVDRIPLSYSKRMKPLWRVLLRPSA